MPIALYMDQHVPRAITVGLRLREIDVVTAYEDGASEFEDPALLDRASALGRVLFTRDDDLLAKARQRQREGISFGGVIYPTFRTPSIRNWNIRPHSVHPARPTARLLILHQHIMLDSCDKIL